MAGLPVESKVEPLVLVQVLRAVAALLVLAGHTQGLVIAQAKKVGVTLSGLTFPGGFGVDLFFCISGFIMVVSSKRLFGTVTGRSTFLVRRATRLVPLYWIATLGTLPMLLYGSKHYGGDIATALATSMLFWPYPTYGFEGDLVFPMHTLGWSLNYEVFFYLLFSLFIAWPMRRAVFGVCAAITAIVAFGLVLQPQITALRFWSQPIILEFAFGVAVGWAWLRGFRLAWPVAAALGVASVVALALNPLGLGVMPGTTTTPNDLTRVASWGLPAFAMLAAAVGLEQGRTLQSTTLTALRHIGDSSYSLYLMHPFALILIVKAWLALGLDRVLPWPLLALTLIAGAILVGLLCFRWVEKPTTRWLHLSLPRPSVAT